MTQDELNAAIKEAMDSPSLSIITAVHANGGACVIWTEGELNERVDVRRLEERMIERGADCIQDSMALEGRFDG